MHIDIASFKYSFSLASVPLASLFLQYIVFGIGFVIDRRAVRMMTITEDISLMRNITHWMLAPPTLLVYSGVAFYAIAGFIFKGKKMAKHDMAAKAGLAANTVASAAPGADAKDAMLSAPLGDSEDLQKDKQECVIPLRNSRTTSVGRERSNSSIARQRALSGQHSLQDIGFLKSEASSLLCELPERFYFGQFSQTN